jgi:predicted ribosome quality control (RQC) complex YloA/Tae2 family protein
MESAVETPPPDPLEELRSRVTRALTKSKARIERRAAAVRADLARMAEGDDLVRAAQWALVAAAKTPRGARALTYTDWSTGEGVERTLPLDPAKSAREQVDAMFKRARRLKQGAAFARKRLALTEETLQTVLDALAAAAAATELEQIEAAFARAKRAAPRDVKLEEQAPPAERRAAGPPKSPPYRTFRSGEHRILVGKGAEQNDELTLHVAKPRDLWLHAKGHTGAHVVVPLAKGRDCPPEALVDAAHLAAHFSEARGERSVEVQYVARRYLRKPRGSPPGFVALMREKVLVLRVEPERIERLLAGEES